MEGGTALESKSSDLGTWLAAAESRVPKAEDLDASYVPKSEDLDASYVPKAEDLDSSYVPHSHKFP